MNNIKFIIIWMTVLLAKSKERSHVITDLEEQREKWIWSGLLYN